eukprot:TRINITY_DN8606_c0_g1_i1.p1 TRINITY_DN8606_c0_g1~~TRINITY_DN8606_c0_g1_i1.p1  ORF type:complete len:1051 (-),score=169.15 TRINITY_DN8606_c0_g1_i1:13-2784(-)
MNQKNDFTDTIVTSAAKLLQHKNPLTRARGLRIVSYQFGLCRDELDYTLEAGKKQLALFEIFTQDPDPRVRVVALQAFEASHLKARKGPKSGGLSKTLIHRHCIEPLVDEDTNVRLEGLKFLWALSNLYPFHQVSVNGATPIPLVDYGFKKICSCAGDISTSVRALACQLLGTLRKANNKLLLQAMSKTLLGNVTKSADVGINDDDQLFEDFFQNSLENWTKENKVVTMNDVEKEEEDPKIVAIRDPFLLDTAAAGAFVHGLEDEFMAVRSATIDSICELSQHCKEFATMVTGSIVDMFNDEINHVRINAIHSLRKMSCDVQLTQEQLAIVLATAGESDVATRQAIYKLLCVTKLANIECLSLSIKSLLANITTYPVDLPTIFNCLKAIGVQHSSFAEFVVEELLNLEAFIMARENHVEDLIYIGKMIVLFNAALSNPNILLLLPAFTKAHYRYMRDKWPAFTPRLDHFALKVEDFGVSILGSILNDEDIVNSKDTLASELNLDIILTLLSDKTPPSSDDDMKEEKEKEDSTNEDTEDDNERRAEDALIFIKQASSNLSLKIEKITNLEVIEGTTWSAILGNCRFYLEYLKCLKAIAKARATPALLSKSASRLLRLTYRMESSFLGLSSTSRLYIHLLRTYAHSMFLLHSYCTDNGMTVNDSVNIRVSGTTSNLNIPEDEHSDLPLDLNQNFLLFQLRVRHLNHMMDKLQQSTESRQKWNAFVERVEDMGPIFSLQDLVALLDLRSILGLATASTNVVLVEENLLKETRAVITHPTANNDKPLEYLHFVPLKIEIQATIKNLTDTSGIMIRVHFPDNTEQFFPTNPYKFVPIVKGFEYMMKTKIYLESQSVWCEKSSLSISIVKVHTASPLYQRITELDRAIVRIGHIDTIKREAQKDMVEDVDWVVLGDKASTSYWIKPKRG